MLLKPSHVASVATGDIQHGVPGLGQVGPAPYPIRRWQLGVGVRGWRQKQAQI